MSLSIDLAPSAGGLYFDTTAAGAGVQVYQPFAVAEGDVRLLSGRTGNLGVADGKDALTVHIARLEAGGRAEFTIDVDDSVVGGALGRTRVAASEMAGARIRLERTGAPSLDGRFDREGRAVTPPLSCP